MHSYLLVVLLLQTLDEQKLAVQEEIVVTASGFPEDIQTTPAAATVITRQELERREARDVIDVLREVPGVTATRGGSPGKVSTLFIRGGSSKQALVMWNGIRLNHPTYSGTNWAHLSTAGVEKVEVVAGPYSALYGADALSGVINVMTFSPRTHFDVDAEAGEHGLRNGSLSGAWTSGAWSLHGAMESRSDGGFAPNDDFRQDTLLAGATFAPRSNVSIALLARHADYDLGIPRNANATFTDFVPTPRRREDGSELQIALPVRFDLANVRYEVRLSTNERDDHFADPDAVGYNSSTTESSTRRAFASARTKTFFGIITAGGELERANVFEADAFGTNVDDRTRTSRALFVEDRLSFARAGGSIEVTLGLRHDDFDDFGGETSPRVAAAWIRSGTKVRAAYGRAFRAPYLGELHIPFFGNPDLKAERGNTAEIGFDRFFADGSLSITAFRSDFEDQIVYNGLTGRFENIGSATAQGVELGANGRVAGWSVAASYTYLDTKDEDADAPLLRRPRHSGSLAVGRDFARFQPHLVIAHKGSRDDVTDLVPFGRVISEAYTVADFTLRYDLGAFIPYLKVENLTDEPYEDAFGYPSGRRRASLGIRYAIGR